MRIIRDCKGFTITELLIAAALSVMLSLCFFAAFEVINRGYHAERGHFNSNRSARYLLDKILKDAKEAVHIDTSYGAVTTDNQNIVLRLPSIDVSGNVINISSTFDYVVYETTGSTLSRSVYINGSSDREASVNETLAANVSTVQFSSADGVGLSDIADVTGIKRLSIHLTAEESIGQTTQSTNVETEVMLRNLL